MTSVNSPGESKCRRKLQPTRGGKYGTKISITENMVQKYGTIYGKKYGTKYGTEIIVLHDTFRIRTIC